MVWLITGSSRGFGRAIAEAVLEKGHKLVATARDPAELTDLKVRYGAQVRTVALDVTDPDAAERAVQAAVNAFGRLDVVVNTAGYGEIAPIEDMAEDAFRAQFEVNFFGVVNVTRAALPVLRKQRSGHFIQFASIGGRVGAPGLAAYQSAKFAVEGFSEVLHHEVSPFGVKVTIVEPGAFRTDLPFMAIAEIEPDYDESVGNLARHARAALGKQPGDPAKAARVILTVVELHEPPLRLLLGSDAVDIATASARALAESDFKWREMSIFTDFDEEDASNVYSWKRSASRDEAPEGPSASDALAQRSSRVLRLHSPEMCD